MLHTTSSLRWTGHNCSWFCFLIRAALGGWSFSSFARSRLVPLWLGFQTMAFLHPTSLYILNTLANVLSNAYILYQIVHVGHGQTKGLRGHATLWASPSFLASSFFTQIIPVLQEFWSARERALRGKWLKKKLGSGPRSVKFPEKLPQYQRECWISVCAKMQVLTGASFFRTNSYSARAIHQAGCSSQLLNLQQCQCPLCKNNIPNSNCIHRHHTSKLTNTLYNTPPRPPPPPPTTTTTRRTTETTRTARTTETTRSKNNKDNKDNKNNKNTKNKKKKKKNSNKNNNSNNNNNTNSNNPKPKPNSNSNSNFTPWHHYHSTTLRHRDMPLGHWLTPPKHRGIKKRGMDTTPLLLLQLFCM